MKRFLLVSLLFFTLSKIQAQAISARTQVIYNIYAQEPSGIILSPNQNNKPNTVTIKSGQRIQLTGYYDQEVVKWYGDGLPVDGSPFYDTFVSPINTGSTSISVTYRANNSNTYAIIVTVLPEPGVTDPTIIASTYCTPNPLLTANGCSGTVKWYKKQGNGLWDPYVKVLIPGAEGTTYQTSGSGEYCATCTINSVESFGSKTLNVGSSGVQPYIYVQTPSDDQSVCMWTERTILASGIGLESGTITWYEKFGTDAFVQIGTGQTKLVQIRDRNTQYKVDLAVPGCPTVISGTRSYTVSEPTTLASNASRTFTAHVQSYNILADNNCQLIAGFAAGENNNNVNAMNGKELTAQVSLDNSVMLHNNQPYLQRHYDFEPTLLAENAWYSIKMYFTQADFDAFNLKSSVKLPSNSSPEEQQKFAQMRIWQTHGNPLTLPATPGNYSGGSVTDYGCVACRSASWNSSLNLWEIGLNTVDFSGFFITTEGATVLPVTLLNFTAQKQENATVLNWQTTEESNSDHFEVQHSDNGKEWLKIGSLNTSGESKSLKHYTYTHETPFNGENLYRLKMVDKDASFAFSRIISIKSDNENIVGIYPNPTSGNVTVGSSFVIKNYQVMNSSGHILQQKELTPTPKFNINLQNSPAGLYMIRLTPINGQAIYKRLVIK